MECIGVVKSFPAPSGGEPIAVLRGIDLVVEEGEGIAVLGPSGAGKSTLLAVMGTLEPPSSGSVEIRGRPLSDLPPSALARIRSAEIGFVFQSHFLLPQLSTLENVLVPAMAAPGGVGRARGRAFSLLSRVGLGDRLAHRPEALSGGERQRTAFARALINSPSVLLADEPTGSLDSVSAASLIELMLELRRESGVALVVVTHSETLASRMERTVRIFDGRISEAGR